MVLFFKKWLKTLQYTSHTAFRSTYFVSAPA